MKKEIIHELVTPFEYSSKGEFHQASIITISAPRGGDDLINVQILDSLCGRANNRNMKDLAGVIKALGDENNESKQAKEQAEEQKEKMTEDESALLQYSQLVSSLEKQELKTLNVCMAEILSDSALVDGEKKFEAVFFHKEMSVEDVRLIIGKYIENFTSSSQNNSKKG